MSLLLFDAFEAAAPSLAPPPPIATTYAAQVAAVDRAALRAFGEPVTYQPAAGAAVPVTGIFDLLYVLVKGDAEAGVEALGPAVFLLLADLPTDPRLDEPTLTIQGVTYEVVERRPDGIGGIVLALQQVT